MTHAYNTDGPPWVCECGWVYARKGTPVLSEKPPRNCPRESQAGAKAPPIDPETLKPAAEKLGISMADIGHWATALARWTAAGFPVRSAEWVAAIHAVCLPCDQYTAGRCRKCGCRVSASGMAIVNKGAMATEWCEKWPDDPTSPPATAPTPPA